MSLDQALALAEGHVAQGQWAQGEQVYRQILQARPGEARALHGLGVLLFQAGHADQAVETMRRAVAAAPARADAHRDLGLMWRKLGRWDDAVACYQAAARHAPDDVGILGALARALDDAGRYAEAEGAYRDVLARAPEHTDARVNLGGVLMVLRRLDEAREVLDGVLRDAPENVAALVNLGAVLRDLGQGDDAVACYRDALAVDPDNADAHRNLATVLQDLGQLDAAADSYRAAIRARPDYGEAHRQLAMVKTFATDDPDVAALERLFAGSEGDAHTHMHAAFALGKAYDDLGRHDDAFHHYAVGNALRRGDFAFDVADVARAFDELKAAFPPGFADGRPVADDADPTPVFVVGLPRSGTTLVEQILASHPDVHGAGELNDLRNIVAAAFGPPEEPGFAARAAAAGRDAHARAGAAYIDALKAHAPDSPRITDKMPGNFELVGLIRLMVTGARVIHCRRDLRDTGLSIFKQYFTDDAHPWAYDLDELGTYMRLYADLMAHWHAACPGFVHDVAYEDVVDDPEEATRALLAFCGLPWDDACRDFHRADRMVQTASSAQVRRPVYASSVQAWERYAAHLGPLTAALDGGGADA